MGPLYLILSLASSLAIVFLLRFSDTKKIDRLTLIAANYIAASLLAFIFSRNKPMSSAATLLALVLGFFFFIAFLTFSLAIKKCGVAGAVTMGRISLAIPVGASVLIWGETPQPADLLCLGTIFLVLLVWESRPWRLSPLLLLLFILLGSIDTAFKFLKLNFPQVDEGSFLTLLFVSATTWGWLAIFIFRRRITGGHVAAGLLLGIPNFFSSYFLLKALLLLPAYIVFPVINVGIITLSAIGGLYIFRERLDRRKVILVFTGAASVLVLSLSA
jgi:glucose uptake protein GlcU